jgi:hypothetical protein
MSLNAFTRGSLSVARRSPSGRTSASSVEPARISPRRVKLLASWIATWALLLSPCAPVHPGLLKRNVDFSNYNAPLYRQIVDRIKAKVAARLGQSPNIEERYFIVPFAYQDQGNNPESAHSFLSVIRVPGRGKQPSLTPGFRRGRFAIRDFETFTISWLPHDFDSNPRLRVFEGVGSLVVPQMNKCPVFVGKNFRLDQTLKLAVNVKNAVGFLGTGFRMWGINATARVLIEYTKNDGNKILLLEPVDIEKDLYGFVYIPERNSRGLYDPFPNAAAYHQ